MPKYRSQAVLGLLCPAKDALHRERDFMQGRSSPTHCCTVLLLLCNEGSKISTLLFLIKQKLSFSKGSMCAFKVGVFLDINPGCCL